MALTALNIWFNRGYYGLRAGDFLRLPNLVEEVGRNVSSTQHALANGPAEGPQHMIFLEALRSALRQWEELMMDLLALDQGLFRQRLKARMYNIEGHYRAFELYDEDPDFIFVGLRDPDVCHVGGIFFPQVFTET